MSDGDNKRACHDGQGLVEYVLLLVLVAIICITALSLLGRRTQRLIPNANQLEASSNEEGE